MDAPLTNHRLAVILLMRCGRLGRAIDLVYHTASPFDLLSICCSSSAMAVPWSAVMSEARLSYGRGLVSAAHRTMPCRTLHRVSMSMLRPSPLYRLRASSPPLPWSALSSRSLHSSFYRCSLPTPLPSSTTTSAHPRFSHGIPKLIVRPSSTTALSPLTAAHHLVPNIPPPTPPHTHPLDAQPTLPIAPTTDHTTNLLPPRSASYYFRHSPWSKLVKFELSTLAAFSSVFGYYLAGGPVLSLASTHGAAMLGGTMLTAFSAAVLNQLLEVRWDSQMERTKRRPLVTGQISKEHAALACAVFAASGAALLSYSSNWGIQAPAIALSTILFYAFVYTRMKRRTVWNTEFGALVGSLPVFVGAAAYTPLSLSADSQTLLSVLLGFAFMSVWQMPHFMMIAHQYATQYAKAGFVMRSPSVAPRIGLGWASLLALLPFFGFHFHLTSPAFILTGTALNAYFLSRYYLFYRQPAVYRARRHIYLYFVLMFAAICLHATNNDGVHDLLAFVSTHIVTLPACVVNYAQHMPRWMEDNGAFYAALPEPVRRVCGKRYHDQLKEGGEGSGLLRVACPVVVAKEVKDGVQHGRGVEVAVEGSGVSAE